MKSIRTFEIGVWVALAALFLAVNLATSSRSPVVWQDEVMFADPAVNLATGQGFTTSAWFQPRATFFAGNAPLYSLSLAPWVGIFGFNVVAVRSWNYVLMLAVVATTCAALWRLGLVKSGWSRLLLALLIVGADGVAYSYRSGRYDCLGMLVVAGLFLALTISGLRARLATLAIVAAMAPWSGLQLIALLALWGLLLLWVRGRSALGEVIAVGLGGAIGSALLVGLFRVEGVWPEFVKSVALLGGARRGLSTRISEALATPLTEPSSLLLLTALGALLIGDLSRRGVRGRSPIVVGLVAGLLVPCALAFVGKYVRYYTWMCTIPAASCVVAALERPETSARVKWAVAPLLLLAIGVGLPARLVVTCLEWRLRDPAPVDRLVTTLVRPGDWAFSEYEGYYPAKRRASVLFLPPYIGDTSGPGHVAPAITAEERERVSVLITKPDKSDERLAFFGGRWSVAGRYSADPSARVKLLAKIGFGSKPYDLIVYRRVAPAE